MNYSAALNKTGEVLQLTFHWVPNLMFIHYWHLFGVSGILMVTTTDIHTAKFNLSSAEKERAGGRDQNKNEISLLK